jgi:hypothetical protein
MIWKRAMRPRLPGAHVFHVGDAANSEPPRTERENSRDGHSRIWQPLPATPGGMPRGVDFSTAERATAPISLTLNNPSTYLIDSGLWTACKESLLAIEKEFQVPARRQGVWSLAEVESFRKERSRLALPETTTYLATVNSRRRYLTVFPGQDLFILQSHEIAAIDWDFIWDSLPTFRLHAGGWLKMGRAKDKRHMALEYDPAWDIEDVETHPLRYDRSFWLLIANIVYNTAMAGPFSLWFIDYRIKRNPRYQEPAETQSKALGDDTRRTFYASDRRFVEVKEKDLGDGAARHDRMWDNGYEEPTADLRSYSGSPEFVQALDVHLDALLEEVSRGGRVFPGLDRVEYGLLACEYL